MDVKQKQKCCEGNWDLRRYTLVVDYLCFSKNIHTHLICRQCNEMQLIIKVQELRDHVQFNKYTPTTEVIHVSIGPRGNQKVIKLGPNQKLNHIPIEPYTDLLKALTRYS